MISVPFILSFGCVVADKLFPVITPIERFIRSLPLMEATDD